MANDAQAAISQGVLARITGGEQVDNPVLQCVQVKAMAGGQSGQERYRLVWSDVTHFIQSMMASQLNELIHNNTFQKGAIVRLTQYQVQEVKGKKILVVLNCDVLTQYGYHEKFGQPVALENNADDNPSKPAQQQPNGVSANGFYGAPKQESPAPAPQRLLPSRPNNSSSHGNIYPIEALSPYAHKWAIKARCTAKSDIKTWHNKNGEGKLFSVNFLDESGEIRATGFNAECDMWYDTFQEGGVYYVSGSRGVVMAKKQFSQLNNDYELRFEADTQVEKVESSEQDSVPKIRYNFTNLADISNVDKDTIIDVIGVLREVAETTQITSKTTSKPYDKRELTLVDNTGFSIRLTVWGKTAADFSAQPESVAAFKGVKVSDFGGRSLSLLASGSMAVDPDIDEAHKLKGWYDAAGQTERFSTHLAAMGGASSGSGRNDAYKTIEAVNTEQIGMSEQAEYFTLKATVVFARQETFCYPACQSDGCNKKVTETDPGQWRCEGCNRAWDKPIHRYVLSVNVSDHTGQMWLSCFDESAKLVMGCSADELVEMKENDDRAFTDKMADANCRTWVFRCRAKMDTYNDTQRVRYQVSSASAVNFPVESAKLAELIKQYSIQDDQGLFVQ